MRGVAADVSNDRCSSLGHESDETRATAREMVGKETADLLGRQQRLSVRDLAIKFESGQAAAHAAAARLAQEVGSIIMSSSPLDTHKTTEHNKIHRSLTISSNSAFSLQLLHVCSQRRVRLGQFSPYL